MENKNLYKNIITLIGGTGLAQSIPLLISPVLSRIYSPTEFGLFAVFISLSSIIGVIASGRYEMAILLPDNDRKGKNIFYTAILLIFIVSFIFLALFLLFGNEVLQFFEVEQYQHLKILIPVGIFLYASINTYTYILNRVKDYKGIATSKVLKSTGVSASQLIFGLSSFTIYGLVFGKLLGDAISTVYNQWLISKEKKLRSIYPDWELMKEQAKLYQEFPKVNAPHAFTNTASSNLPNILLASFSPAIAGFYNFSHRICFAPIQLVSASVQQVYSREVTERYKSKKEIFSFSVSIIKKLAYLAVIPFIILLIFAPQIFGFIFGSEWQPAGVFAQILSPFIFLVFIVSPLSYIPLMLNQQRKAFIIDIIYLILRISALAIGLLLGSEIIAIVAFTTIGVIIQLYLLIWILSLIKKDV